MVWEIAVCEGAWYHSHQCLLFIFCLSRKEARSLSILLSTNFIDSLRHTKRQCSLLSHDNVFCRAYNKHAINHVTLKKLLDNYLITGITFSPDKASRVDLTICDTMRNQRSEVIVSVVTTLIGRISWKGSQSFSSTLNSRTRESELVKWSDV